MIIKKALAVISVAAILGAMSSAPQGAEQDVVGVRGALGVLNRVVGHTQRLIDAKNYARLPHEDGEFREGVVALEKAVVSEPADLKQKVEPLIKQAKDRSHALADAAAQANPAELNAAHDALASSVRTLITAFPEGEHPPTP